MSEKLNEMVETACRAKHFLWPSFTEGAKATERHIMRAALLPVLERHVRKLVADAYRHARYEEPPIQSKCGDGPEAYAARIIADLTKEPKP